ncbi:MAG: glycosyltransferase family 4 protein [Verrucomicrobia bacterium]|nr:glycosyltransferase family 4 protein [Verrucomicrobiota bacterium]
MHLIFLTLGYHPDQIGGAFRYVTAVAERLAARAHQVTVVYPASQPTATTEARAGVRLLRYPNPAGPFWANWRRENKTARQLWQGAARTATEPALLVGCHAYFASAFRACAGPRLFLFTGPWAEEHRFARQAQARSWPQRLVDRLIIAGMRRSEGHALRHAGCILTISRYYQEQLARWHGANLPPVRLILAGVDPERFHRTADRGATRAKFGLSQDQFLFLAVRRLDPRMGLLTLIDGFGRIAPGFPAARLWIAGTGPQRGVLAERIARQGLEASVKLLGLVPEADLVPLLNAADCVVVPSLDLEGFGLITVESLTCGTPVVASKAGANPEILSPLDPALMFATGSAAGLAARLESVLRDPGALPDRTRCRDYAVANFSWDRTVVAFEEAAAAGLESGGAP